MVLSLRDHKTAVPASHGRLPDSGRKAPLLRPEPDHSMMADGPPRRATPQAPTAPPCPRAGGPLGYKAPAPEVFVPALAAWPAPQTRPAPPAMLPVAPRPTLN